MIGVVDKTVKDFVKIVAFEAKSAVVKVPCCAVKSIFGAEDRFD